MVGRVLRQETAQLLLGERGSGRWGKRRLDVDGEGRGSGSGAMYEKLECSGR